MNIQKLLEMSRFSWPNGVEALEAEFASIVDLISSLPDPENLDDPILEKYSTLSWDEEDRQACKEDILEGSMFVI